MTVTKRDLAIRISEATDQPQQNVVAMLEQFIVEVSDSLVSGDVVTLRNFGTFQTAVNQPKIGRNPLQPDVDIVIPARRVVRFKVGKNLRESVGKTIDPNDESD